MVVERPTEETGQTVLGHFLNPPLKAARFTSIGLSDGGCWVWTTSLACVPPPYWCRCSVAFFRARKRHINVNFLVRLPLGRPRECPGDEPGLSLGQNPLCPGTNPIFLLILHWKPSLSQRQAHFVTGTISGTKGGRKSLCVKSLCAFFGCYSSSRQQTKERPGQHPFWSRNFSGGLILHHVCLPPSTRWCTLPQFVWILRRLLSGRCANCFGCLSSFPSWRHPCPSSPDKEDSCIDPHHVGSVLSSYLQADCDQVAMLSCTRVQEQKVRIVFWGEMKFSVHLQAAKHQWFETAWATSKSIDGWKRAIQNRTRAR